MTIVSYPLPYLVQEENQSIIIATAQTIVSNQASFASYQ
jgi:hypothetical protein